MSSSTLRDTFSKVEMTPQEIERIEKFNKDLIEWIGFVSHTMYGKQVFTEEQMVVLTILLGGIVEGFSK